MRYCFDIDGTICTTDCEYEDAVPYTEVIEWINKKYDEGHHIQLYTSRGTSSGIDWFDFTLKQIEGWGVKYNGLKLGKPNYDLFVDDRAMNNKDWYKKEGIKI
tara:strand:- start:103 stop:411 length:309 start_codon:yes stop_codon:yes gene_type:complete